MRTRELIQDALAGLDLSRIAAASADPSAGVPLSGADWLAGLPAVLAEAVERWDLRVEAASGPRSGHVSVVLPVRRRDDSLAALKATWPQPLSRGEHVALRVWGGVGAVRLLAADPNSHTILLEWLNPELDLQHQPLEEACATIGTLIGRLAVPATGVLPSAREWLAEQLARPAAAALPRRMTVRAHGLLAELADPPPRILHGDLHFRNVLTRQSRGGPEWVAIDPHPLAGHPGLELQAVLRNRVAEYPSGSSLRWAVRQRIGIVCEAAGLDEDPARHWAYLRACVDAIWAVEDADAERSRLHIALLKALDG